MKLLSSILRFFLSLRYKLDVKGAELLQGKQTKFILPNHQALVDPQIVFTQVYRFAKISPVMSEKYFKMPVLKYFFRMLNAVPVSDISNTTRDQNALHSISTNVVKALEKGHNVLLYPSGQIAGQGFEKIFNKQSAWVIVNDLPEQVQVIGVRVGGLWGSMWSRAWIGKTPGFLKTCLKAIFYAFANLFFLLPKRKVTIEFFDITTEAREKAKEGKNQFNNFLESLYNANGEEPVLFLKHYFYGPKLKRQLPSRIEGSIADQQNTHSFKEEDIPEDVLHRVTQILVREAEQDEKLIRLEANLNMDLNIDSLGLVVVISGIEKEFKRAAQVEITSIKTVADLCFIAMNRKLDDEELKPSNLAKYTIPVSTFRIDPATTIPKHFIKSFSKDKNETFAYDKMLGTTTRKEFLLKAMVVSRIIRNEVEGKYVGIMLPALQSSALLVAASYLAGKIPVMLNWTVGPKVLQHCIESVHLKQILTAKTFYDKVSDLLPETVKQKCMFFEQKVREVSFATKMAGVWAYLIKKTPNTNPDDPAVILFTSGSESLPKAVELTHKNILSDLHGSFSHIILETDKIFLSFLPPFHSFGFSILTIFPLVSGAKIAYTPDPTDSREVLKILLHTQANTLLGTPTFLKMLLAVSTGNDLKHVKLAISGAESLHSSVIESFAQKTGGNAKLIEGYGITECSPILTINPLELQKQGSVGQFIKGVECLITDINTFEPLPQGKEGMIMVFGDNIFHGYTDQSLASPFVTINGKSFYKTGDLGYIDKDSYLYITGRLKRFIKIAGEMISLPAIENMLLQKYGNQEKVVLAIEGNDQIEPPQIFLFATTPIDLAEANAYLKQSGFSSLVKINQLISIDEIPLLGTGKTDYKVLKNKITGK
jgi:acyl-CoA synthetase (AMP-forming)/AMP-acid ligase II/1-acyl-sn-glycerol-3-phosphate acyltransferase/acyl carrier protein